MWIALALPCPYNAGVWGPPEPHEIFFLDVKAKSDIMHFQHYSWFSGGDFDALGINGMFQTKAADHSEGPQP